MEAMVQNINTTKVFGYAHALNIAGLFMVIIGIF